MAAFVNGPAAYTLPGTLPAVEPWHPPAPHRDGMGSTPRPGGAGRLPLRKVRRPQQPNAQGNCVILRMSKATIRYSICTSQAASIYVHRSRWQGDLAQSLELDREGRWRAEAINVMTPAVGVWPLNPNYARFPMQADAPSRGAQGEGSAPFTPRLRLRPKVESTGCGAEAWSEWSGTAQRSDEGCSHAVAAALQLRGSWRRSTGPGRSSFAGSPTFRRSRIRWRVVSCNALDLTGSRVFGWFAMNHASSEVAQLVFPRDRSRLVLWGIDAARANNVDLAPFGPTRDLQAVLHKDLLAFGTELIKFAAEEERGIDAHPGPRLRHPAPSIDRPRVPEISFPISGLAPVG